MLTRCDRGAPHHCRVDRNYHWQHLGGDGDYRAMGHYQTTKGQDSLEAHTSLSATPSANKCRFCTGPKHPRVSTCACTVRGPHGTASPLSTSCASDFHACTSTTRILEALMKKSGAQVSHGGIPLSGLSAYELWKIWSNLARCIAGYIV